MSLDLGEMNFLIFVSPEPPNKKDLVLKNETKCVILR